MHPDITGSARTLSVALLFLACGGTPPDEDTAGTTGATAASTGTDSSVTGGQETSAGTDTGGQSEREICDRYLACVAVVAPGELPAAQMGFGSKGSCWQGSEDEAELCLEACASGLETFNEAFPDEEKCGVCQENAECDMAGGELCYFGKCTVTSCSDGVVDAKEVCDGQPGCDADCLGPSECNLFSNHGCTLSLRCSLAPVDGAGDKSAVCTSSSDFPRLSTGESCGDDVYAVCDLGLGCASAKLLPSCEPGLGNGCCTSLCVLSDTSACSPSQKCVPYEDTDGFGLAPELSYLGLCVPA